MRKRGVYSRKYLPKKKTKRHRQTDRQRNKEKEKERKKGQEREMAGLEVKGRVEARSTLT